MTTRSTTIVLALSAAVGAIGGVGSTLTTSAGRSALGRATMAVGVTAGVRRRREPQPGDHWGGCNDARAAGTAPIRRGEPGYRPDMDGDNDGIACEAHPG